MANSDSVNILLRVQDEASAKFKAVANSMGGFVGSIQNMAAGFGAGGALAVGITTVTAALTTMAVKLSEEVEQLDNLSSRSGVSAKNLQILQFAFQQGGVDAEALTKGLDFLNRAIARNDPALAKIGVTSRDTFNAFMEATRGLQGIESAADRAKAMFDVFGRGGAQMAPILAQLATDFSGVTKAATDSGNVISDMDLKKMRELDAAYDKIASSVGGMAKEMAVAAAGPLVAFAEAMERLAKAGEDQKKITRTWEDFFLKLKGFGPQMFSAHGPEGIHGPTPPPAPREVFQPGPLGPDGGFGVVQGPAFDPRRGLTSAFDKPPTLEIGPALDKAREQLVTFTELMEHVAGNVMRAFDTIGRSLQGGLLQVFMSLTDRAQTFKSAVTTIFQSLVSGIMQAIGELLASQAVKGLFKLLGIALTAMGFPIAGAAVTVVGEKIGGGHLTAGPSAGAPVAAMSPGPTTVNNYYQAISSKDLFQSMSSPMGSLRAANSRLFEIAAAS